MSRTGEVLPAALLAIWEAGVGASGPVQALALHTAARPRTGREELRAMPVGTRERDLYALRRTLFGDRMQIVSDCGACGEVVEFELDAARLGAQPAPPDAGPLRVTEEGWTVDFRLPTVADLDAVAASATHPGDAGLALVTRCTVAATRDGEPVPVDRLPALLPEPVLRRLADAAAQADPAAEVVLRIGCPQCGAQTPTALDIASYLWAELDSWARDLLLDVHLLASAYGWSEHEILALSPLRRRYYLELCTDG